MAIMLQGMDAVMRELLNLAGLEIARCQAFELIYVQMDLLHNEGLLLIEMMEIRPTGTAEIQLEALRVGIAALEALHLLLIHELLFEETA